MYRQVLKFWFEDIDPKKWWVSEPEFDAAIREKFAGLLQQAASGELYSWRLEARGRLAEIIVLDQFSRNMHRNTPHAFSQDPVALVLAQEAISLDVHHQLAPVESSFLFMPFMHSESRAIHAVAEQLYREFAPPVNLGFELRHKAIIDRFGRYPHRNAILGRVSTAEEIEFLKQPGSSF
jgi:uncharacterized protein (DUF924 family)